MSEDKAKPPLDGVMEPWLEELLAKAKAEAKADAEAKAKIEIEAAQAEKANAIEAAKTEIARLQGSVMFS
jgi:hypothetical protein